jgi:hypothetical protein
VVGPGRSSLPCSGGDRSTTNRGESNLMGSKGIRLARHAEFVRTEWLKVRKRRRNRKFGWEEEAVEIKYLPRIDRSRYTPNVLREIRKDHR